MVYFHGVDERYLASILVTESRAHTQGACIATHATMPCRIDDVPFWYLQQILASITCQHSHNCQHGPKINIFVQRIILLQCGTTLILKRCSYWLPDCEGWLDL